LNYIPDVGRGLEELCRVVCPGGTIAAYVWDYAEGARFLREFWDAAAELDDEGAALDQARRFPICTPDGLRELFQRANLAEPTTQALDIVTGFSSFDDYWQPLLSNQGSAPSYLATRSPQIQIAIRERLRTTLPVGSDGSTELPARAWAVRGKRS
jgi:hypothetical protein